MDLQNIVIDFTTSFYSSIFEGKQYDIPVITNIVDLKGVSDNEVAFDVTKIVVQYDYNISLSEPRVIFLKESNEQDIEDESEIIQLENLSEGFLAQLSITRLEIEAEITNQNS